MASLLFNDSDKHLRYKYSVEELYIINNGVSESFPLEKIAGFKIENHFENATFPIFRMTLMMHELKYYDMIKNKNNVKFKLRIQYYHTDMDNESPSMKRNMINDVFVFFPEESNANYDRGVKTTINEKKDTDDIKDIYNRYDIFLFKKTIVNGIRSTVNAVLNNCDLTSAMGYLLDKAGCTDILMSPFDNNKIYSNIVLPPQSIEKQIKYLNNNYGFHKDGTIIYFGLSHSYIIRCNGLCTAWEKNENKETIIYILEENNPSSAITNNIQKHNDKRSYISTSSQNMNINEMSVTTNVITGLDAEIINTSNNKNEIASIDSATVGSTNRKIIFNNGNNEYMKYIYESLQYSNGMGISLILSDIDISSLNLNKSISIIFESQQLNITYGGRYRIASSIFTLSGSYSEMSVNAAITLKKVKNK